MADIIQIQESEYDAMRLTQKVSFFVYKDRI